MILIGKKIIVTFEKRHPQSRKSLAAWEQIIKQTDYYSFNALQLTFPSVDYIYHQYTIFNISGNKYRLITEIDYSASLVHVKRVWTHAEYSMNKNAEILKRRTL